MDIFVESQKADDVWGKKAFLFIASVKRSRPWNLSNPVVSRKAL